MFGKPDFIFRGAKLAVFVDGCFWHRHTGCKFAYTPKSRHEFWLPKFASNVARDKVVVSTLKKAGWRVVRIWECQLAARRSSRVATRIKHALDSR
jgi:DNA mismatch endonuclease (patch repair protein)